MSNKEETVISLDEVLNLEPSRINSLLDDMFETKNPGEAINFIEDGTKTNNERCLLWFALGRKVEQEHQNRDQLINALKELL